MSHRVGHCAAAACEVARRDARVVAGRGSSAYTPGELRELVAYAAERGVAVVPEIEMPGHVRAALAAYPHLGNVPGRQVDVWTEWGVCEQVLGVHDAVLDFCRTVLGEGQQYGSLDGWHDLQITIDGTAITYCIDGQQVAQHGEPYLPETPQWIDFNHWLIDLNGQTGSTPRSYDEQVDYVYFVKDQVLTPAQVQSAVAGLRGAGTAYEDTVPTS